MACAVLAEHAASWRDARDGDLLVWHTKYYSRTIMQYGTKSDSLARGQREPSEPANQAGRKRADNVTLWLPSSLAGWLIPCLSVVQPNERKDTLGLGWVASHLW
jgi:hypothetical protein